MDKLNIITAGVAALALTACSSIPERTGSFYECNRGTKLNVNYLKNSAIVRVDNGRPMSLRQVSSNSGTAYESNNGVRLHRQGNNVTWNTAARTAPETCRTVNTPF